MLRKLFHAWERRLACRDDPERTVLPFEWGIAFLGDGSCGTGPPKDLLLRHAGEALAASDEYFSPGEVRDFQFQDNRLTFTTPRPSPYPENNTVRGLLFPRSPEGPAVVVLSQWNARPPVPRGLCRLLNRFGLSALHIDLPYHGARMPAGLSRADYMLSPNLGRTLQASRQAVVEARAAISWLQERGYGPIGILGTSLGSCIAFIAFAHDARFRAGVFNHVSPYFADVVWRGISTWHVRKGLEKGIGLDELREIWLPISPRSYVERLEGQDRRSLLVLARYDLSFPPDLSRELVREFERRQIPHERFVLPCGHYTTGKLPFNVVDGLAMAGFLRRHLLSCSR